MSKAHRADYTANGGAGERKNKEAPISSQIAIRVGRANSLQDFARECGKRLDMLFGIDDVDSGVAMLAGNARHQGRCPSSRASRIVFQAALEPSPRGACVPASLFCSTRYRICAMDLA